MNRASLLALCILLEARAHSAYADGVVAAPPTTRVGVSVAAGAPLVPSHGTGLGPTRARFLVRNERDHDVTIDVATLRLVGNGADQPLRIDNVVVSGARLPFRRNSTARIPAGTETTIEVWASSPTLRLAYHAEYHHEATFRVGDVTLSASGKIMIFRAPREAR